MQFKSKSIGCIIPIIVVGMFIISSFAVLASGGATSSENTELLLDEGNGDTYWMDITTSSTYASTIEDTLNNAGYTCTISNSVISIEGKTSETIGSLASSGGTFIVSGTTGITVTSYWIAYIWNEDTSEWETITDLSDNYNSEYLAVGFYPVGYTPAETPENPSSWTCIAGDSENSGTQTADLSSETGTIAWSYKNVDGVTGVYSSTLVAGGFAFVKYGYASSSNVVVVCYDLNSGDDIWEFWYKCTYYETTTDLVVGDYLFVQSSNGQIYKFNWKEGPGEDNSNVKTFNGESWGSSTAIPDDTGAELIGSSYGDGAGSMVCDSGTIYVACSNGMIYCFDLDLNLLWSYQTSGHGYFTSPTVYDDYVSIGMYDGHLYILNKTTGSIIVDKVVYTTTYKGSVYGQVSAPCFLKEGDSYIIFASYSDGRGMSSQTFGIVVYEFNGEELTEISDYTDVFGGGISTYLSPYTNSNFNGIYFMAANGLYKMDTSGNYELLNSTFSELKRTKSSLVIVNDEYIYIACYNANYGMYKLDLNGKILGSFQSSFTSYCMCPVTVVDGMFISGNDNGVFAVSGAFNEYVPPADNDKMELWEKIAIAISIFLLLIALIWAVLKYVMKWEKPFAHVKGSILHFFFGEDYTHNTRNKHRLWAVMLIGLSLTLVAAIASLCIGSNTTMSIGEMFNALISSIQKGGHNLTYNEMLIYNSRLPRILAAVGVGIGLSVAGAMYQAIIRNPLVDPYIMGVSAGAGTAAIAVIAFDFTFFGLFSSQDIYLTAFAAIIGGLVAFAFTMILAEKAGGTSVNYVLAGIIIGLVFSAIQTLLMIFAGAHVSGALTWLYGSFALITWDKVWLILVPAITISLIPLIWAKEFNLVLLGEEQAKQMGLSVKKFNRIMLIAASVLTSFCVAFVGIIGFVGLVIPHLCRMILGGDHRLVLPASMAFGGALMIFADLLSRVLLVGYELPVGAITTIIGVPVFAYLLIKRGKMYDG
jgi:ABC-type Fe3+-siderophore transport system permease subunit